MATVKARPAMKLRVVNKRRKTAKVGLEGCWPLTAPMNDTSNHTRPDQETLYWIHILLERISMRLPKSYSDEDSSVDRDLSWRTADIEDRPPEMTYAYRMRMERIRRVNEALATGADVSFMEREKNLAIERERSSGRHDSATAIEITIGDVKTAARKTMEWISDNADMKKGTLRLGTYERDGFKCDVNAKLDISAPSLEFNIDCKF
jgi:hypothetical protein